MAEFNTPKKTWPLKRTLIIFICMVLLVGGFQLYSNFNRILSDTLIKSFNSLIISDVYELKFEKLALNPFEGTIRIFNVTLLPREKPVKVYPYINSSFRLKTEKITLKNVSFMSLLKSKQLRLERISITKPDVEVMLVGKRHIMLPFKDSIAAGNQTSDGRKNSLESLVLKEFHLIDASFHTMNTDRQHEFKIKNFNISLYDLMANQKIGEYLTSFNQVSLSAGAFNGDLKKGDIKHLGFKDFNFGIDSLQVQFTLDTLIYRFHDFHTGLNNLDIQTRDSVFHVTMQSFNISYQDKSIQLKEVGFEPNVSHDVLQKKHRHQHTEFSGSVGTLDIRQINFDSLLYAKKLFVDEISLDNVKTFIFKDKTKPLDTARFPVYLGQTVSGISLPILIKHIRASNVQLTNTERKPDSNSAKVTLTRATLEVKNITNLAPRSNLIMSADAFIEGKAHFKAGLTFPYSKPEFGFEVVVDKFNLPDLNPLIGAYTPAKINKGILDGIKFSGLALQTKASGTMKFLYHDLEIDLELHDQAKWKSAVIAFAANSILHSSNPGSTNLPPREVQFKIERNMNKGFVNIIIKSLLNGLKETMIMSKENRKSYNESKKKAKNKNK